MVDEEEAQLYRAWEYMENPLAEHSDDLENGLHTGSLCCRRHQLPADRSP